MTRVETGNIHPEDVGFQAKHVLFVEGKDGDAFDPKVLNALFSYGLSIKPLGPSFSVKSAAEALHPHHPTYYFLIDRDHYEDAFVERCWANFPDPETHNLLVWRRREIENYFLDPQYLIQSKYCRVNIEKLGKKILHFANQRLFLDVANNVIISIREELKRNWIEKFSNPSDFRTKADALHKLESANEFDQHRTNVRNKLSAKEVERRFEDFLERITGGQEKITFGAGEWLHLIQGKAVFSQLVHSECFQVIMTNGKESKGNQKRDDIVKNLLQQDESVQPADFKELKKLIDRRVSESS